MNDKIKKQLIPFFDKYKLIKYKKGQIIFKPGEKVNSVLLDKSGYIRIYKITKDGREITLPILKALFFCSMVNVLLHKENKYYVQAISPVELWMVPENEFMDFVKKDSELYETLNKSILNDFAELTDNIQNLVFADSYTKVAGLIYDMVKNFGEIKEQETIIDFNIPHRMLASMTGLTRETVTLQILKLQKEGFLYNKGRKIVIKNIDKLREIARI